MPRRPLLLALLVAIAVLPSCDDRPDAAATAPAAAPSAPAAAPGAPLAANAAAPAGANAAVPKTAKPPPVVSPEIAADHRVTFRIKAANAKEVQVRGQWAKDPLPMVRGEYGVWSATSAPIDGGVWEYSLVVDGLAMIDPGNPWIKPMREPRTSILDLPSSPLMPWDFQDVRHGTVHQHDYQSKALGVQRSLSVYTPPGYETSPDTTYPLLVLQHGSGDNQLTWVTHGKAHWILDNLIAAGKAKPMVVVMLFGHQPPPAVEVPEARRGAAQLAAFQRELFEDALPLVESLYRVSHDRKDRAITGLSMGGSQSLSVGLANLERFAWIGAFSAGPPDNDMVKAALSDAAATNAKLKLLWISIGKEDFLLAKNQAFEASLTEHGIRHEWQVTDGGHAWPVWRRYLTAFVPLLFQP
jgi:enterochelin esterase family protein